MMGIFISGFVKIGICAQSERFWVSRSHAEISDIESKFRPGAWPPNLRGCAADYVRGAVC